MADWIDRMYCANSFPVKITIRPTNCRRVFPICHRLAIQGRWTGGEDDMTRNDVRNFRESIDYTYLLCSVDRKSEAL